MGEHTPATNPWSQVFGDNYDKVISITVTFDETTRQITGGTIHRDDGCQWSHVSLGLGPDGTPNTSPDTWEVSPGDWDMSSNDFASHGLNTIEDVEELNITAW